MRRALMPSRFDTTLDTLMCASSATIPPQQVGRHPAFIEKHILADVAPRLPVPPLAPGRGNIRPALFVGLYGFS